MKKLAQQIIKDDIVHPHQQVILYFPTIIMIIRFNYATFKNTTKHFFFPLILLHIFSYCFLSLDYLFLFFLVIEIKLDEKQTNMQIVFVKENFRIIYE